MVSHCPYFFTNPIGICLRAAVACLASLSTEVAEGNHALLWVSHGKIASGYVKIAIEHGPCIVDLPIKNGDFP